MEMFCNVYKCLMWLKYYKSIIFLQTFYFISFKKIPTNPREMYVFLLLFILASYAMKTTFLTQK